MPEKFDPSSAENGNTEVKTELFPEQMKEYHEEREKAFAELLEKAGQERLLDGEEHHKKLDEEMAQELDALEIDSPKEEVMEKEEDLEFAEVPLRTEEEMKEVLELAPEGFEAIDSSMGSMRQDLDRLLEDFAREDSRLDVWSDIEARGGGEDREALVEKPSYDFMHVNRLRNRMESARAVLDSEEVDPEQLKAAYEEVRAVIHEMDSLHFGMVLEMRRFESDVIRLWKDKGIDVRPEKGSGVDTDYASWMKGSMKLLLDKKEQG